MILDDALLWNESGYDLCIGNPPYIRHHHVDDGWRAKVLSRIQNESGVSLKKTANVYLLFLMQSLLRANGKGLVIQLIPFEWVTRPSAKELREHIRENKWEVSVYRFSTEIFPRVLTTASIAIIDKGKQTGKWTFGEIGKNWRITPLVHASGSGKTVLKYAKRAERLHALRGLSPGGQEIFVLTEQERVFFGLKKRRDVIPCVTSLRHVPPELSELDSDSFNKHFVDAGKRCWLIRSDREKQSRELVDYLEHVGEAWKKYSTCTARGDAWWQYRLHPVPALLFSSGFVGKTTKVLVNDVKAIAVGSIYGVLADKSVDSSLIATKLRKYDFRERVVSHSNNLKKVEVNQLNALLETLID